MRRAPVSGRARLGGASARRHSRLHRWATQRLPARRGAAILHPISQRAARIEGMALCTRARRVRIARRGDRTVNYVRAMPGQQAVRRSGSKSQSVAIDSSELKLSRVPKEAYLKSHPRNTLVSGIGALFCSGTDARTHTVTCVQCSDRGYFVRRTKPLLPWSHRHNNSTGAAERSAQTKRPLLRTTPPPRPW